MTQRSLQSCLKKSDGKKLVEAGLPEKIVSFDDLEILEFKTILGDNPAVSSGPPIALDSKLVNKTQYDIDFYEYFNPSGSRPHKKSLVISVPDRASLLIGNGYKLDEIADATMQVQLIQVQRLESFKQCNGKGIGKLGEAVRTTGRMITRFITINPTRAVNSERPVSAKSA